MATFISSPSLRAAASPRKTQGSPVEAPEWANASARRSGVAAKVAWPSSWMMDADDDAGEEEWFASADAHIGFARQPIVDASGSVYAFELFFRSVTGEVNQHSTGAQQTAAVMCAAVFGAGLSEASNGLPIWINVDGVTLLSPIVEVLAGTFAVIELHEALPMTPEITARVKQLREMGIRFALDNLVHPDDPRLGLIEQVEYLKVDISKAKTIHLHALLALGRATGKRMLAERVETSDEQARLFAMGFEFVQGYACGLPVLMAAPQLPGCNPTALFRLYLLAENGASAQALSLNLMHDPGLVARLFLLCGLYGERHLGLATLSDLIDGLPRNVFLGWIATLLAGCTCAYSETWSVGASKMARSLQLLARQLEPSNVGLADRAFFLGLVANFRQSLRHVFTDKSRVPKLSDELEVAASFRGNQLGQLLEFILGRETQPLGWRPFALMAEAALSDGSADLAFLEANRWAKLHSEQVRHERQGVPVSGQDRPLLRVRPEVFHRHLSQLWGRDVGAMAGRLSRGHDQQSARHC